MLISVEHSFQRRSMEDQPPASVSWVWINGKGGSNPATCEVFKSILQHHFTAGEWYSRLHNVLSSLIVLCISVTRYL